MCWDWRNESKASMWKILDQHFTMFKVCSLLTLWVELPLSELLAVLIQSLCLQKLLPFFDIPYLPHYMHLSPFRSGPSRLSERSTGPREKHIRLFEHRSGSAIPVRRRSIPPWYPACNGAEITIRRGTETMGRSFLQVGLDSPGILTLFNHALRMREVASQARCDSRICAPGPDRRIGELLNVQ